MPQSAPPDSLTSRAYGSTPSPASHALGTPQTKDADLSAGGWPSSGAAPEDGGFSSVVEDAGVVPGASEFSLRLGMS